MGQHPTGIRSKRTLLDTLSSPGNGKGRRVRGRWGRRVGEKTQCDSQPVTGGKKWLKEPQPNSWNIPSLPWQSGWSGVVTCEMDSCWQSHRANKCAPSVQDLLYSNSRDGKTVANETTRSPCKPLLLPVLSSRCLCCLHPGPLYPLVCLSVLNHFIHSYSLSCVHRV